MDDNTKFLRALLRQDWDTYNAYVAEYTRQGIGTPVAIIACAFHLAVQRRFKSTGSMAEIIRFVADTRVFFTDGKDLPPREAEALICAVLDMDAPWVEEIVDRIDILALSKIEGQLVIKLILDEDLSDDELDAFLADAEHLLHEQGQ